LWQILDAAGESDIGEPPILDRAKWYDHDGTLAGKGVYRNHST
jgi:hypothetical protein